MVSRGLWFAETPTRRANCDDKSQRGRQLFSHRLRALITRLPARHYPIRAYLTLHP
jgi:hypothetical protein